MQTTLSCFSSLITTVTSKAYDAVQWIGGKINQLWLKNTISPINTFTTEMRHRISYGFDHKDLRKKALVFDTWNKEIERVINKEKILRITEMVKTTEMETPAQYKNFVDEFQKIKIFSEEETKQFVIALVNKLCTAKRIRGVIDKEKILRITEMVKNMEIETPAQYKNLVNEFQKIKIFSEEETKQLAIALANKLYTVIGKDCKVYKKLHDQFNKGLPNPVESQNLQDIGTIIKAAQLLSILEKIKERSPYKKWPALPLTQTIAIVKNLLAAIHQNNRLIIIEAMTIKSDQTEKNLKAERYGLLYPTPEQKTTWSELPLGALFFKGNDRILRAIKEKYNTLSESEKTCFRTFLNLISSMEQLYPNPVIATYKQTLEWMGKSDPDLVTQDRYFTKDPNLVGIRSRYIKIFYQLINHEL
jgi:CxxC motif-containing protein